MLRCAVLALFLSTGLASAAVIKANAIGCRVEADAKNLDTLRAQGAADKFDAFSHTKISSGDCTSFARGTLVTVEGKHPPLMCARLEGDFDCFWLPDRTISLEAPKPVEHKTTGNRTLKF